MTPQSINELYNKYHAIQQRAADLNNASAVLGWDQEVYMPARGAGFRAQQLATLATSAHELLTSDQYEKLLRQLSGEKLNDDEAHNVRLSLEDLEKNKKLPVAFVNELSRLTSKCFNAWVEARKRNDYSIFAPMLADMVALKRKQADLYGYEAHPYDALLDEYEKGATVAMLEKVFETIKARFPELLSRISSVPQITNECFHQHFPRHKQWDFSLEVLGKMGLDFEAGRQDYSEHPFTTSFSPEDVRITTRVDEDNYASMLWSSIHEGGHALYEQGLPTSEYGMPLGSAASLGIHESQSRLWENCIGRSYVFWTYFYPRLQTYFPAQLNSVPLEAFYKAMNRVVPSLIRTEADELTYHYHVMIRYEIEKALMEGALKPAEMRDAWNSQYKKYLGITPPDDVHGILHDVHWSHGSFGYFPTYTLGSFYAAQLFAQAQKDITGLGAEVAAGAFGSLLAWLREHVHRHGRRYTSEELCVMITGKGLDPDYFINYATEKYTGIYDLR